MIGIVNINKPKGVTSSNVVVKIKKLLNIKKVGHMGTLDPLASGVLPICVGKATRLFDYFLKKQKTYIAQFKFGEETNTLDLEGEVIKTSNNIPTLNQVKSAIEKFIGEIDQIPPMFSSKKINGKKAYDLARKGEEVELQPCKVVIYDYKVLNQINDTTFEFLITCSAGTYIRCLARDLGKSLNSCATMVSLIRTKTGVFEIEDSIDYETLSKEVLTSKIIPLEQVLIDFEKFVISQQNFQRLLNGLPLRVEELKPNTNYAIYCNDKVIGIGVCENSNLKIKTYLAD